MTFKKLDQDILRVLRIIKFRVFIRKKVNYIVNFFKNNFSGFIVKNPVSLILIDPFTVPEWVIANSYFVNILAKEKQAKIKTFGKKKRLTSPLAEVIFKSFNVSGHVHTIIEDSGLLKVKEEILSDLRKTIDTKQKLHDLRVHDIWIGIDIYETYLRNQRPTIDFNDSFFWSVLEEGIEFLLFWEDFFSNNSVSGVIVSHDCYNSMDILAKVAYKFKSPVYMPNALGVQKVDSPFDLFGDRFKNYKKYFNRLSNKEKVKAIQWSNNRLDSRLSGEIGVDMRYPTKSAFASSKSNNHALKVSNRIKVLIAPHDFYDNPHGYGGMLFTDFHEWLTFLVDLSKKTDYDWYIKIHPDYSSTGLRHINDIVLNSSNIALVPQETSWNQLAEEGLNFVLTCWGSVGHELPLLGVQVINASSNTPHVGYDFNWHAETIDQYRKMLLNLGSLKDKIDISEIYEFYYVHQSYIVVDDFIFDSYVEMRDNLNSKERFTLNGYIYFIDRLTDDKNLQIIDKMTQFINSNKKNYFINGPEN